MRGTIAKPQLILLDVDGTMIDSVPDLTDCVNFMLRALRRDEYTEQQIRGWVGNGVERLLSRALTGRMGGQADAALLRRASSLFAECYEEHNARRSRVYAGVREGLDGLREQGYLLGSVTNKPECFTHALLKSLDLHKYFAVIVAGDTLANKKPHPAPLLHAAAQVGAAPGRCLMVGDSISDVQAARAAGFAVVCVDYGYNHGRDIRAAAPDAVIDSLARLDALFV